MPEPHKTYARRAVIACCACLFVWLGTGCATAPSRSPRAGLLDVLPRITNDQTHRMTHVTSLAPGEVLRIPELTGPGVIRHMWVTAREGGERLYKDLVLRIWWDGEANPSVEVPLGDFFGVGWGEERPLRTLPIEMIPAILPNHAALNSWWPMPFQSARIELEHQGSETVGLFFWIINWERVESLPEDWGRFHAHWHRENPVPRGGPYTVLETHGTGRYVGTIMNYRILEPGSWVEGGEAFWIDGRPGDPRPAGPDGLPWKDNPTLQGSGAEDYFGLAWGFRPDHNMLFHGTSFGPVGDRTTTYRFHIVDPIRFQRSIRVTFRCHGWDVQGRSDDYASVALWYQTEPHRPFPPMPKAADRVPDDLPAKRLQQT